MPPGLRLLHLRHPVEQLPVLLRALFRPDREFLGRHPLLCERCHKENLTLRVDGGKERAGSAWA